MKFFIKKCVMTENEKNIEKAFGDSAAGTVNNVTAPAPPPIPKLVLPPMEMGAGALFAKLDSKREVMLWEQRMIYDRLSRRFEEDGHTALSLSWDDVNVLRRLYATLFYSR